MSDVDVKECCCLRCMIIDRFGQEGQEMIRDALLLVGRPLQSVSTTHKMGRRFVALASAVEEIFCPRRMPG